MAHGGRYLAIISKQRFETDAPGASIGDVLTLDRYAANPHVFTASTLRGGQLFLVTVRPGDVLWLVAILDQPRLKRGFWMAATNTTPITDLTGLIPEIRFASNAGLAAKRGRLGMALQTPRALADSDVEAITASIARPITRPAARVVRVAKRVRPGRAASISDLLDTAIVAAGSDDLASALRHLLAVWQVRPAPSVADAIERVGARAQAGLDAPRGRDAKANKKWHAAARGGDPVIRGTLIGSLMDAWGLAEARRRIKTLAGARRQRDPRFTRVLADFIEFPIEDADSSDMHFWKVLFEVLPRLGDPRLESLAQRLPASWAANAQLSARNRQTLASLLSKIRAKLREAYSDGISSLSPVDEERCAAVLAALRPPDKTAADRATERELLAMIHAAPADDHPREVYADWLQQRGDSYGELIALQLSRGVRGRATRRETELVERFGTRWLGRIAHVPGVVFERGRVSCAKVKSDADTLRSIHEAASRILRDEFEPEDRCVMRAEPDPDPERIAFAYELVEHCLTKRMPRYSAVQLEAELFAGFAGQWARALELARTGLAECTGALTYYDATCRCYAIVATVALDKDPGRLAREFQPEPEFKGTDEMLYRLLLVQPREVAAKALAAFPEAIALELLREAFVDNHEPRRHLLLRKTQRDSLGYVKRLATRPRLAWSARDILDSWIGTR